MQLREKCDYSSENVELKNNSRNTTDIIETIGHPNLRLPYNYTYAMYQLFPKLECLFLETGNNAISIQATNAYPPRHPPLGPITVVNYSQWQL
jgi:hypothetical protein